MARKAPWGWRLPAPKTAMPTNTAARAKGQMTRNPWKEAFLTANVKFMLIASIVVIGEGVV